MLPKPAVPEGSRKTLNGIEVFTRHNFTTEIGNVFETMGGEYILPNGEEVKDKAILELLPDQHKQKALAWWNRMFGGGETQGKTVNAPEVVPGNVESLMAQIAILQDQIATLQGTKVVKDAEPDVDKEPKKPVVKPRTEKIPDVLVQMGIAR